MCFNPVEPESTDSYHHCCLCGGLFLNPYPEKQNNSVFSGRDEAVRQQTLEMARHDYFLRHLMRIEKQMGTMPHNPGLMEIGCGSGVLLQTAISRGWRADALELSPELAGLAGETNPSSNIIVQDVLDHTPGESTYDAVMALDVIEHVLDPELMLKNCRAMLKPEGLLLLQTPNTRGLRCRSQKTGWEMRDPGQHINLFSPEGLVGLLQRTNFRVEMIRTISGSGMEKGAARVAAWTKQWLLDRAKLGNALCVLARRI